MARLFSVGSLLIVLAAAAPAACSDDAYPTNVKLVEAAVEAAFDSVNIAVPPVPESDIEIVIEAGHPGDWLVEDVLSKRVISRGWDVRVRSAGADSVAVRTPFALKVRIIHLDLVYARQWRRYIIASKVVERAARASFHIDLVDRDRGVLLESTSTSAEVRDVVPAGAIELLTDPKYSFAAPELEKANTDKYLEGGLVLAIIGVLIYLFYSNKTAS